MQSVKGKNTKPEIVVRRIIHAIGLRFRLHRKDLPGSPDIVLPRLKKVIFVNGCFWHGHSCKKGALPKSRREFWNEKIERNKNRDAIAIENLKKNGWCVLTIWQCETHDLKGLRQRLAEFLR